ncbi:MAG TPA: phosphoribosylanthranilate isomerase [Candidatus Hydrogenedentes bacterium]|nr:phosphoribosylanthranilate isomerase [Candidatus Hydrogenedentota bacterium]
MKIKICGITNAEDALAACEAGADALGFVFAPEARKRNRYIASEAAREIIAALPPFLVTVAVTVNEPLERLREYLQFVDRVQLHGEEPEEVCRAIAPRAIKAFRAGPGLDMAAMRQCPAGACLLDAAVSGERGGTGTVCDWDTARSAVDAGLRIILAGGLTPENVGEAVRSVRPYAVDVSGGVESAPGKKDHEKIRQFIQNARSAMA